MAMFHLNSDTPVNDPTLRRAAQLLRHMARLSMYKAALHHQNPARYPLPAQGRCLEALFARYVKEMSPGARRTLIDEARGVEQAAPAQRSATLGPLAGVDFASSASISDQVLGSGAKRGLATELARIPLDPEWPRKGDGGIDVWPPRNGGGNGNGGNTPPVKRLVLRLHRVKCVEDTGEAWKDEIDVAAGAVVVTTVDQRPQFAKATPVEPFRVGSFKKGTELRLGDRILYPFTPPPADRFPAMWLVALQVVERDHGRDETINNRVMELQQQLMVEVRKMAARMSELGESERDHLEELFNALVTLLLDIIAAWLADEFFDPAIIGLSVGSPDDEPLNDAAAAPRHVVTVTRRGGDDGKYELTYSWAFV